MNKAPLVALAITLAPLGQALAQTPPAASAAPKADAPKPKPPAPKAPANAADDPLSAKGNMWGDSIGDSFGHGGLGLSGIGPGGGGRGEGIGLGTIGTLGHGAGTGSGQGFGRGSGRLGGARGKPPSVRMGASQVSGRLPPEVIQRIVRQQFGALRLCYERGLRKTPTLQGRVVTRFMIDGKGAVESVSDAGSDLPDKDVVACAQAVFKRISYPAPEGGKVSVVYPIMFSPGDDAPRVPATTQAPSKPEGTAPAAGPRAKER